MTSYGSLSDLHTIVERQYNEELYFSQIGNDPDSYAGWSFYTPVRATQADSLKDRGQTK